MQIKECYVSHNGISCFTNINSLVNIKDINFYSISKNKNIVNNLINKNNLIFYISLRICELVINDFTKNIFYLYQESNNDNLIPAIMFS